MVLGDHVAPESVGAPLMRLNEFTVGFNRYINGHKAQFTVDASYLPDGSPNTEQGIGVLSTDDDSFIFRAQFQLLL